jgi:hypothetical protein
MSPAPGRHGKRPSQSPGDGAFAPYSLLGWAAAPESGCARR